MRKIVMVIGALAAALAAEGLVRVASFVSAFNGADADFYYAMLFVMVFVAVVFVLGAVGKAGRVLKYLSLVGIALAAFVMMEAPSFGANVQALLGMIVSFLCALFIKKPNQETVAT